MDNQWSGQSSDLSQQFSNSSSSISQVSSSSETTDLHSQIPLASSSTMLLPPVDFNRAMSFNDSTFQASAWSQRPMYANDSYQFSQNPQMSSQFRNPKMYPSMYPPALPEPMNVATFPSPPKDNDSPATSAYSLPSSQSSRYEPDDLPRKTSTTISSYPSVSSKPSSASDTPRETLRKVNSSLVAPLSNSASIVSPTISSEFSPSLYYSQSTSPFQLPYQLSSPFQSQNQHALWNPLFTPPTAYGGLSSLSYTDSKQMLSQFSPIINYKKLTQNQYSSPLGLQTTSYLGSLPSKYDSPVYSQLRQYSTILSTPLLNNRSVASDLPVSALSQPIESDIPPGFTKPRSSHKRSNESNFQIFDSSKPLDGPRYSIYETEKSVTEWKGGVAGDRIVESSDDHASTAWKRMKLDEPSGGTLSTQSTPVPRMAASTHPYFRKAVSLPNEHSSSPIPVRPNPTTLLSSTQSGGHMFQSGFQQIPNATPLEKARMFDSQFATNLSQSVQSQQNPSASFAQSFRNNSWSNFPSFPLFPNIPPQQMFNPIQFNPLVSSNEMRNPTPPFNPQMPLFPTPNALQLAYQNSLGGISMDHNSSSRPHSATAADLDNRRFDSVRTEPTAEAKVVTTFPCRIEYQHTLRKTDSDRLPPAEQQRLVHVTVRVLQQKIEEKVPDENGVLRTVYYIPATDLGPLIGIRKNNVPGYLHRYDRTVRRQMMLETERVDGGHSRVFLNVLTVAGAHRFVSSSRSPHAAAVWEWMQSNIARLTGKDTNSLLDNNPNMKAPAISDMASASAAARSANRNDNNNNVGNSLNLSSSTESVAQFSSLTGEVDLNKKVDLLNKKD